MFYILAMRIAQQVESGTRLLVLVATAAAVAGPEAAVVIPYAFPVRLTHMSVVRSAESLPMVT